MAQNSISKLCPSAGFGSNANYIEEAQAMAASYGKMAIQKLTTAFRMYRVSGNFQEFEVKAREALAAADSAFPYLPEGEFKNSMILSAEALRDAMLVRASRNGDFGAKLSGSALLALNDKYGLNDVSAYRLDNEIINFGIEQLNRAGRAAKYLGLFDVMK